MNIDLFKTVIQKHSIIPTDEEFTTLDSFLSNVFNNSTVNSWALETGKSTGEHDLLFHTYPQGQWLVNKALLLANQYWNSLKYRKNAELRIDSSWANLHLLDETTGEHSHCGGSNRSHVSCVYYLKKPLNSGHIEFVDPLEYIHRMSPLHEYSDRAGGYTEVPAEQFDLILFPSWIKHKTQPNKTNDPRVAISMNFKGYW